MIDVKRTKKSVIGTKKKQRIFELPCDAEMFIFELPLHNEVFLIHKPRVKKKKNDKLKPIRVKQ